MENKMEADCNWRSWNRAKVANAQDNARTVVLLVHLNGNEERRVRAFGECLHTLSVSVLIRTNSCTSVRGIQSFDSSVVALTPIEVPLASSSFRWVDCRWNDSCSRRLVGAVNRWILVERIQQSVSSFCSAAASCTAVDRCKCNKENNEWEVPLGRWVGPLFDGLMSVRRDVFHLSVLENDSAKRQWKWTNASPDRIRWRQKPSHSPTFDRKKTNRSNLSKATIVELRSVVD